MIAAALFASAAPLPAAERQPNIVFILADDLGWTDLGCQGSKFYETPTIDELAAQGGTLYELLQMPELRRDVGVLMSGQYGPRTGVYTVGSGDAKHRAMDVPANVTQLPLDQSTIADVMKSAGYATGRGAGFRTHLGSTSEIALTMSSTFASVSSPWRRAKLAFTFCLLRRPGL